jgi:GTPase SAR1 family protein
MLGASGVGKTALICQFTTSEYICAYDASLGEYRLSEAAAANVASDTALQWTQQ